jgi:hypothetical protein
MTWWENGSASQYFLSTISVVALRQRQTARTTLLAVEASRLMRRNRMSERHAQTIRHS